MEDATLICRATGNPEPRVTWRREDGDVIHLRKPGSRNVSKGKYMQIIFQSWQQLINKCFKRPTTTWIRYNWAIGLT